MSWKIEKIDLAGMGIQYTVVDENGRVICRIDPGPDAKRNATLIACLPELLKIEQSAMDLIKKLEGK